MSSVEDRLRRLERRLDPRWDEERTEAALAALHARGRGRRPWRTAATVLAAAAASVAVLVFWPKHRIPPVVGSVPSRSTPEPDRVIRLSDGTTIEPLSASTHLVTREVSVSSVTMSLEAGAARFRVRPARGRLFCVRAGEVLVFVLGTEFVVEREDRMARVRVESGEVRVEWPGGSTQLRAGEVGTFPPRDVAAAPSAREPPAETPHGHQVTAPAPARAGEDVEVLLAQADEARLGGRPADAVPPLRRVLAAHPGDPRAPIAGFMLGRVYLEDLDDPAAAGDAFARARALGPDSPLAEDALAREVEAWARARRQDLARLRAQEYVARYPDGRRLRAVKKYGGVE